MWKKQWNKLKTALGEPEEYIEAEPENEEVPEEVSFRSEPVINVKFEDFVDIAEMMKLSENIKKSAGEMALRHARERQKALQWDDEINAKIQEQIKFPSKYSHTCLSFYCSRLLSYFFLRYFWLDFSAVFWQV